MKNAKKPLAKSNPRYWFHAKTFGWGWGMPARREGWAVYLTYLVVVVVSESWLGYNKPDALTESIAIVLLSTVALVWVCIRKGEPTKWSWGRK